jgi:hypothetical protein
MPKISDQTDLIDEHTENLLFNKFIGIWRDRNPNDRSLDRCAAIVAPVSHAYSDWQCKAKPGYGHAGLFCKRHAKKYPAMIECDIPACNCGGLHERAKA